MNQESEGLDTARGCALFLIFHVGCKDAREVVDYRNAHTSKSKVQRIGKTLMRSYEVLPIISLSIFLYYFLQTYACTYIPSFLLLRTPTLVVVISPFLVYYMLLIQ